MGEANDLAAKDHVAPSGPLRIALPSSLALTGLASHLADFMRRYAAVTLDVAVVDRPIDLIEEGFDVAIAVETMLSHDDVVGRRVPFSRFIACCTNKYLGDQPRPEDWLDMKSHRVLCLSRFASKLREQHCKSVDVTTSSAMLRLLALEGCGIAILPAFLVREDLALGRLAPVLEKTALPEVDVWVAYSSRQYVSAKVSRFVEETVALLENLSSSSKAQRNAG